MALPIGFHAGQPSYLDGIGDMFRTLNDQGKPIAAKGVDGTGSLFDAQQYSNSICILRLSTGFGGVNEDNDVPRYGHTPISEEADRFWESAKSQFIATGLDKRHVWIELLNEMNKDLDEDVNYTGHLSYEIATRAVRDGYLICLGGWAAGTPEPYQWLLDGQERFLRYAAENRDKVALTLHEYSYTIDKLLTDDKIGRFVEMNNACIQMGFEPPNIFITEFGWEYTDIPEHSTAVNHLSDAYGYYLNFPNVKCLIIWCLDKGSHWDDIDKKVNPLMTPVTNIVLPGQIDMGEGVPPIVTDNLLVNHNFSGAWSNIPATHGGFHQVPEGWGLHYSIEGVQGCFNSKDDEYVTIGVQPECIHKLNGQLPPNEQLGGSEALVLSGTAVYKIFGTGIWSAGLSQIVRNLTPGATYRFTFNLNVHYHDELGDDSPDDTQAHFELSQPEQYSESGILKLDTRDLPHKVWVTRSLEGVADSDGELEVWFNLCTVWVNSRSVFLDDFSLELVDVPVEPPTEPTDCQGLPRTQYPRVYVLLAPSVKTSDWGKAVIDSTLSERMTVGYSADDAGIGELVDKSVIAVNPTSWGGDIEAFFNDYYPGTKVYILEADTPADMEAQLEYFADHGELPPPDGGGFPLDGLELGYFFNIPYVLTNSFNAPRTYGNGLHEGMDMDVTTAVADSKESVLCGYDGIVSKVRTSTGAYYNYVVVRHDYNGVRFYTWYCHLDAVYVSEGDAVGMGHPLGEIGDTGGGWAEHLHFNLQVPGHGLDGYVVPDVIDPAPYVKFRTATVSGHCHAGLNAVADPRILPSHAVEVAEFQTLNGRVMKVLSAHTVEQIVAIKAPNTQTVVIRAFLDWGGRAITPYQFYNDTIVDLRRAIDTVRSLGITDIHIELHNEPNLVVEGLNYSWNNGYQFATFMLEVLDLYKSTLTGVKYMFPGLSPGWESPGERYEHDMFLQECDLLSRACDSIGCHAYWSEAFPISTAVDQIRKFSVKFSNKKVFVTEASRNDRPQVVSDMRYAQDYRSIILTCRDNFANVECILFYIVASSNEVFRPENWINDNISRGFAAYLTGL